MSRQDDRARQEFTTEAEELLDSLARDLTELETKGTAVRPDVINNIFREVHSLKGLAGMLGFTDVAELAHVLEDLLDGLRMGRVGITTELTEILSDAHETLTRYVGAMQDEGHAVPDAAPLLARIHEAMKGPVEKDLDPLAEIDVDDQTRRSLTEYEEHRLRENIRSGSNLYSVSVTYDFSDFDERLRTLTAALNDSGEVISTLPAMDVTGGSGISFRLLFGTTLTESELMTRAGSGAAIKSLRKTAQPDASAGGMIEEEELSLRSMSSTVRVDISKLDQVMNIVGELIVERTRMEMVARSLQSTEARPVARELTRISRSFGRKLEELQKSVIDTRLVPISQLYARVTRAARKLARELGKEVDLVTRGSDTELDKLTVEELADPLMHLIRNALDHGIETPDERRAAGKSERGTLTLDAYQRGSSVVIDVRDDGRGIDPVRVRTRAVRRGLIGENEELGIERAIELLFMPGFSTADQISEISGRGVGLDVVRKNIHDLKGTIEVLSGENGGTAFRIVLPITLAILQALIVGSGPENYAIPLTSVDELVRIGASDIQTVEGREVFFLRDQNVPLLRLSDAFGGDTEGKVFDEANRRWFVVVTRSGDRQAGIMVDEVLRQQEIVIKPVGERLSALAGIAGATEIGESEVILVVDIASLVGSFGDSARARRRQTRLGRRP
ncbi:MAG TPA: chemotaxis protein CheA [Thermoanaerobaculia bacterium]|nr:chemotaxis protein CheA [Thermoanaerobaculia bacterium]